MFELDDLNLSGQLVVSANPAGIGPPVPVTGISGLPGSFHASHASLLGDPLSFPVPVANVMISGSSDVKYKAAPFMWIRSGPTSPPLPQNVVFGDPLGPVGVVAQTILTNWISIGPVNYVTPSFNVFGSANGLGAFNWIGAKTKLGVSAETGAKTDIGAQSQIGAESRIGAKAAIGAKLIAGAYTGPTQIRLDVKDAILQATKKSFDLPHPTKENWRLRHVCLEGPSADIYIRGKTDRLTIDLPDYWTTFVDYDSITVTLTPLNGWQELYVKGIEGNKIHVRNNTAGSTFYSYTVYAERIDGEKVIPEYEGTSPDDYPGNSNEFVVNK
jgi:hypothetical protein